MGPVPAPGGHACAAAPCSAARTGKTGGDGQGLPLRLDHRHRARRRPARPVRRRRRPPPRRRDGAGRTATSTGDHDRGRWPPGGPTGDPERRHGGHRRPAPITTPTTSASTTTSTTTGSAAAPAGARRRPVTAVGDSIMIDIQPALEADIPVSGRRVGQPPVRDGHRRRPGGPGAGSLGRVLVVELGTNGTVTSATSTP